MKNVEICCFKLFPISGIELLETVKIQSRPFGLLCLYPLRNLFFQRFQFMGKGFHILRDFLFGYLGVNLGGFDIRMP